MCHGPAAACAALGIAGQDNEDDIVQGIVLILSETFRP